MALVVAATAAAGCSSTAVTAAPRPPSRHLAAGQSCSARPGWAALTLADTSLVPVVTVPPGAHIVVTVPGWNWGTATDVDVAPGGIVQELCTVVLAGRGRRTIFLAARPGRTRVGATVQPPSDLAMPAWGGEVIVQAARRATSGEAAAGSTG